MLKLHLNSPMQKLKELTSRSAAFQSMVGAADETEALDSVHLYVGLDADDGGLDGSLIDPLPRVSVYLDQYNWRKSTSSSGPASIGLIWMPEFEIPSGTARKDEGPLFLGIIETILDEMKEQSLTAGELNVREVDLETPPMRCDPTRNNGRLFWFLALKFRIGG